MKGKLIVIDGTDGSGKATQTKLLIDRLKKEGYAVEMVDFPQYGKKSAALVEEYLNGKFGSAKDVSPYQASIFYACDRFAASFDIRRWLLEEKIVVANRYVSANMGHQAGKIDDVAERKRFLDWLDNLEFGIFNLPRPDLTLFLFVPAEIGQKLVDKKNERDYIENDNKDIHEKNIDHLKDAQGAYLDICKNFKNWIRIDCSNDGNILTREKIHGFIWQRLKDRI